MASYPIVYGYRRLAGRVLAATVVIVGGLWPMSAQAASRRAKGITVRDGFAALARGADDVVVTTTESPTGMTITWRRAEPSQDRAPSVIKVWPRPAAQTAPADKEPAAQSDTLRLAVRRIVEPLDETSQLRVVDRRAAIEPDRAAPPRVPALRFDELMIAGLDAFRAEQWVIAANYFVAATELNQGDSTSRIHAAQALVAVKRYDEALAHVRRAVDLRPLLVRLPLDLSADYSDPKRFAQHVDSLAVYAAARPDNGQARLLLAFMRRFGGDPGGALADMAQARKLLRSDPLLAALEKVTFAAR